MKLNNCGSTPELFLLLITVAQVFLFLSQVLTDTSFFRLSVCLVFLIYFCVYFTYLSCLHWYFLSGNFYLLNIYDYIYFPHLTTCFWPRGSLCCLLLIFLTSFCFYNFPFLNGVCKTSQFSWTYKLINVLFISSPRLSISEITSKIFPLH